MVQALPSYFFGLFKCPWAFVISMKILSGTLGGAMSKDITSPLALLVPTGKTKERTCSRILGYAYV